MPDTLDSFPTSPLAWCGLGALALLLANAAYLDGASAKDAAIFTDWSGLFTREFLKLLPGMITGLVALWSLLYRVAWMWTNRYNPFAGATVSRVLVGAFVVAGTYCCNQGNDYGDLDWKANLLGFGFIVSALIVAQASSEPDP